MPNRILRESICTSEDVDGLSPEAEVFFYRLIVQADDFGRFDARAAILRARCFPLRLEVVSDGDVIRWLSELEGPGVVRTYEVAGRWYGLLTNWGKYQRTRADASKFPDPPADDSTPRTDGRGSQTSAAVIRDSRFENRGVEESRNAIHPPAPGGAAPTKNGKSPFAIDDGQGYLIGCILDAQPGWRSGKGALTYPGVVKLIQAHGASAVTDALQELWLRVQSGDLAAIRTPHGYLERMVKELADTHAGSVS